jgi:hypothetical protein
MQLSVKLLPLYSTIALVWALSFTAYYGRAYGRTKDALMLSHHQSGIWWSAGALALTVALIEMVVHEVKVPRSWLFSYHLPAALGMAWIFILMASWATGLRYPNAHRALSRIFLACLVVAAGTGGVILAYM